MSKRRGSRVIIALITSILIVFASTRGLADNIAPEVQTQINKRTDLFQKSINNLPSIEKSLEDKKQATINAMGDGKTSAPQGLSSITKQSKSDLENESGKLESIHENDLNSRGREEMMKKNVINELYPDYSRPLNKQYMKDAKDLSEGQNKLMANLFAKLKEVGVDCKTIKGDKKHEPEYFIKMKNSVNASEARKLGSGFGDTIYNQTFCEELRNKYHCNDSLSLNCAQWGMNWNIDKDIIIKHREIDGYPKQRLSGYYWFTRAIRWGSIGEYDYRYFANNEKNLNELKSEIAKRIGIDESQIHVPPQELILDTLAYALDFSRSVNVVDVKFAPHHLDSFSYRFTYKLGTKICTQWAEDWNERCRLQ
jgi:hypothetical protein